MVGNSYNKTVIDFNFGRHKALSALKSDINLGLAASMNITFSGSYLIEVKTCIILHVHARVNLGKYSISICYFICCRHCVQHV